MGTREDSTIEVSLALVGGGPPRSITRFCGIRPSLGASGPRWLKLTVRVSGGLLVARHREQEEEDPMVAWSVAQLSRRVPA